jgi:hypothetical protein
MRNDFTHIPIYHITHVDNLSLILKETGLWSDAQRIERGLTSTNIAHSALKERRLITQIPLLTGNTLGVYVPFYFCNRSPMLYSIHTESVEGYASGQKEIVYLVSSLERVVRHTNDWCFTDGHGVEAVTQFYTNRNEIPKIDWNVIDHWSWKNTQEDNDRKRRKQAEFLVKDFFPWHLIEKIGVYDKAHKEFVEQLLVQPNDPIINIEPKWYY